MHSYSTLYLYIDKMPIMYEYMAVMYECMYVCNDGLMVAPQVRLCGVSSQKTGRLFRINW